MSLIDKAIYIPSKTAVVKKKRKMSMEKSSPRKNIDVKNLHRFFVIVTNCESTIGVPHHCKVVSGFHVGALRKR